MSKFSVAESRRIIDDLFEPRAKIYWMDYLATISLVYLSIALVRFSPLLIPDSLGLRIGVQSCAFVVSCLAIYRAVMFIHELVHLRAGAVKGFASFWNLTCGIPFLVPSFLYHSHLDHHRSKHYGTDHDGEYLSQWQRHPRRQIVLYFLQPFLAPPLTVMRFLVLVPLSWLHPAIRRWVHRHLSSLVIEPHYVRDLPDREEARLIRVQETLCFMVILTVILVARVVFDRWPYPAMIQAYTTAVGVLLINAVRTLGAHRYRSKGREMTFVDQFADSVNFSQRATFAELWAPLGLRYHALHHLFPSLPYHAMPAAHRRLMQTLPRDSLYAQTEADSLLEVLREVWQRSDRSAHAKGYQRATGSS